MKVYRLITAQVFAGVVVCSSVGPANTMGVVTGRLSAVAEGEKSELLHIRHRHRAHRHRTLRRRYFPPSYAFDFRPTFYVPWVSLHERHYVHQRPLPAHHRRNY